MPNQYTTSKVPISQRFWESLDYQPECWLWTGAKGPRGYGHINVSGRSTYAHRYAFELAYGDIPQGMCVLHHCDNRLCCRPDHLFLGTPADNAADMVSKGRQVKAFQCRYHLHPELEQGELNPSAKLTNQDVVAIRDQYRTGNVSLSQLGRKYHVCFQNISDIVNYKTWKHL